MTFLDTGTGNRLVARNLGGVGELTIIRHPDDTLKRAWWTAKLTRHEAMVFADMLEEMAATLPVVDGDHVQVVHYRGGDSS